MIKEFNLEKMLETMNKGQIMKELESVIDTAIAEKIEQETRDQAYQAAKERVANDTYSLFDIELLLERLLERDEEAANIFAFFDSQFAEQENIADSKEICHKGPRPAATVDMNKLERRKERMPIFESEKATVQSPWGGIFNLEPDTNLPAPKTITIPATKTDLSFEEMQAIMKALGVN